ncbi:MAG: TonB-dependent receptor [Gammaproteobacteria bacterium]|nr:TonB-dependent receptor [Gammaproteobacteria bacterium]MDP2142021.1 TonB-dependent receptor [Gammaproteobacteria bacterium]MDP2348400.1 TonB-dependent receptor [Gammaproteobacteria bacterium]
MKISNLLTMSSVAALLGSVAATTAPVAMAQSQGADIEEVVVTGSRRAPRTALDSAAPVDVFSATDFQDQGTADLNDLLRNLVPTFNVDTQDINDSNSLVRPATLRGLPADDTLVLVNGKRRHRSAAVQFGREGTHFPDIAQIPPIALRQVEVLRDGAAAQYGSDAIAGVINFILKENREGLSIETKTGHYTKTDDGQLNYMAANLGLPLGNTGFASLSMDMTNQKRSDRSIQRGDAQGLINAGNKAVRVNAQHQGLPDTEIINLFANIGVDLGGDQTLYSFTGYSEKEVQLGFFYRNPENRAGVFTRGANQLFFDLTPGSGTTCPTIPRGVNPVTGKTSSVAAYEYGISDPQCFTFLEWFPGGYTPDFGGEVTDMSNVTGIKGELDDGTSYDLSIGNGFSEITYYISNTTNPSMGPDSPTSFSPGIYTTIENNVNLDLSKPFDVGLYSPLNVAYGIEWRREVFKVASKDQNSYRIGPYANLGAGVGSDGFQGFGPDQQGTWDRKNWSIYADLEVDATDRLLLGAAIRYEDFYDTFGDTTNGKLTARYALTDNTNLRSTVSTGFRAPSPGQANISNISTGVVDSIPVTQGQIPPTNPISQLFGGTELTPEKSRNFSVGVATEIGGLDLTLDYYRIELRDRILNSATFDITPELADQLEASGISGARSIVSFNYYTNDMSTTNQGVELVGSWSMDWDDFGRTEFQASWAWTKQRLDSFTPGLLTRANVADLEKGIPANRGNFRANHNLGDWRFTLQANYYDEYFSVPANAVPARDYWVGSEVIFGGEAAYTFRDRYTVVVGADNLLNTMPEKVRPVNVNSGTSNKYVTNAGFSPNGRFLYARFKMDI